VKIICADFSGFCHGVTETIKTIDELLSTRSHVRISCIGLPVHNPQVTSRLIDAGLNVVEDLKNIPDGILVVRAHGLSPQLLASARSKSLEVVDTTCCIVKNVQQLARKLHESGYRVIITGESKHPEVKAIFGYTEEAGHICSSVENLKTLDIKGKVGVVSQTTFSKNVYMEMLRWLVSQQFAELRVYNTLCSSIEKRSMAATDVAQTVDVMLVIGGRMSSNTKRLYEACKAVNTRTYHVETKDEISEKWFASAEGVGITAGASTPQWIIAEIIDFIEKL
jgi:(E)-4-hydroxy-3-methyl-but-2-enyl pyrophosphate reductase